MTRRFLLSVLLALITAPPGSTASAASLVLTHVTLIDGTGSTARLDMSVEIRGQRIERVVPTAELRIPPEAQVLGATGRFLIRGLWDMHVHTGERDVYLPLYVANGVTGVRDMGGDLEQPTGYGSARYVELRLWRQAIEDGSLLGPRMVLAGFLIDGFPWPGNLAAANPEEGRRAVDVLEGLGVDFIKVKSFLTRDTYLAIAAEARRTHVSLAGHVPGSVRVAEASDAGQKSIEHLTGVALGCSPDESELMDELAAAFGARDRARYARAEARAAFSFDGARATALFARFVKNGTWQVPTLVELKRSALGASTDAAAESSPADDPRLKYLPPSLRERWKQATAAQAEPEAGRLRFASELALVRRMHEAGVPIMAGTDSANPAVLPGFSLHEELTLLVEAGLTPMEALQAATLQPARYFGRERELGTIESGKLADMVLLNGDPLADIANTQKIEAVIVGGRPLSRADLDTLLARVETAAK